VPSLPPVSAVVAFTEAPPSEVVPPSVLWPATLDVAVFVPPPVAVPIEPPVITPPSGATTVFDTDVLLQLGRRQMSNPIINDELGAFPSMFVIHA
jgi:hypothetical protein